MTPVRSRRDLLIAAGALVIVGESARATTTDLIEPRMRLRARSWSGLTVALTLDACPGAFDARIADGLVKAGIPATVFVTGAWIRRNPQGAAFLRAHPAIFAIENHGDRHIPPVLGDRRIFGIQSAGDIKTIQSEVMVGAADVRGLTGASPLWYRGATGFYSRPAIEAIEGWGFGVAGYSLNADAGASLPAATVARRIAAASDGDVIVAHVNQPNRSSGAGVVAGVDVLRARGARFVRLDRLTRADVTYGR